MKTTNSERDVPDFKARHLRTKFLLQSAGSNFNEVARELGLSHSTVLSVSNSRSVSAKVQELIAKKIGVHPGEIWPERYPDNAGKSK
ncbi:helix-turn-helix domain-containing protein [Shimia sp. R9_1]|nr:helix-turn-helix domain-containing protein [Shimia sp. R9_1]